MISILIPVYNFGMEALVGDLLKQAQAAQIPFEIRLYDDGSTATFKALNRKLVQHYGVIYEEMPQNLGRSAIRNRLAKDAQFEQLLFMDCDSAIESDDYLSNYIDQLDPGAVLCGGRSYRANPPADKELYLRWLYGKEREVSTAESRRRFPYRTFMTNNFVVPKSIFQRIGLNEALKGYGHEDTLFGLELKQQRIPIVHIENSLCHIGLETHDEFLRKTSEGIHNLAYLIQHRLVDEDVRLFRYYQKINRWGLSGVMLWWYTRQEQKILNNLRSQSPNLKKFDFYKLGLLLESLP